MLNTKWTPWLFLVFFMALVSLSCNLPFMAAQSVPTLTAPPFVNATIIAQTVIAGLISPAAGSTTGGTVATNTVQPPDNPTNTPQPPVIPDTVTPTFTLTPRPCNQAVFVTDVTIPDGTEIQTNSNFTKTWRLKNNGSCTWTSGYHVIFDSGDRMNAPDAVSVTGGTVPYGSSVDVSVSLKAPASGGTYHGNFRLRSPEGVVFGIGGGVAFFVEIVAKEPEAVEPPPVVVGQPDLVITDITFTPAVLKKGQAVTVKVTSYNQGTAAAGPYIVKWWPGELYGDALTHSWNVDGMPAKGGQVHTFVYAGYPSVYLPSITTKAMVDSGNTVAESNEGNNVLKKVVTVPN